MPGDQLFSADSSNRSALEELYGHVLNEIQRSADEVAVRDAGGNDATLFLANLLSTSIRWGSDIRVETHSLKSIESTMFESVIRSTLSKMIVLIQRYGGIGNPEDIATQDELEQAVRTLESFVSPIRMSQVINSGEGPLDGMLDAISESLLLGDQDFVLEKTKPDYQTLNATAFVGSGRLKRSIPGSSSKVDRFLLESKPYNSFNKASIEKDLRFLSHKLFAIEQHKGILPVVGFRDNAPEREFQLVFAVPSDMDSLQTLDSLYERGTAKPSLKFRLHLCLQLAEAVLQAHMLGLVHKHIRPDNILVSSAPIPSMTSEPLPSIFLSGWQYTRNIGAATPPFEEGLWQRNIYQHPERQGNLPDSRYRLGHDIYSLGVCILEALTWDPLVVTIGKGDLAETSISESYKEIFDRYEPSQGGSIQQGPPDIVRLVINPKILQSTLLHMSEAFIPVVAGPRMTRVVCECLTCLDHGASFGVLNLSQEGDDKAMALSFIDTVLDNIRGVLSAI